MRPSLCEVCFNIGCRVIGSDVKLSLSLQRKTERLRKQVERSFEKRFGHPMTYDGDEWLRATRNHQISKKRGKSTTAAPYWDASDRSEERLEEYYEEEEVFTMVVLALFGCHTCSF